MNTDLHCCPLCSGIKCLKHLEPTVWGCEICRVVIEMSNLSYTTEEKEGLLKITYTIVKENVDMERNIRGK